MNATEKIKSIYTLEDFKEIADHGCQSGVCTQHIYYGDTVQFYDTYEVQILDELVLNYGYDFLVEMFKEQNANLTWYKNAVVWAFIELTAIEAVEDHNYEYAQANADALTAIEAIEDAAYTEDAVSPKEALGNKIMAMGL